MASVIEFKWTDWFPKNMFLFIVLQLVQSIFWKQSLDSLERFEV